MRKTLVALALLTFAAALLPEPAEAAMFRRRAASDDLFPGNGALTGLSRVGKVIKYKNDKFLDYYGENGARFLQYGLINLLVAEYTYGAKNRRLTIEIATMESATAAAGLYYYHRGKVVQQRRDVKVGEAGVIDAGRGDRSLYFFGGQLFVKVVYSGPEPVPDLTQVGELVAVKMPIAEKSGPDAFDYIRIPGVNQDSIELTPGFTFSLSFLPPSVTASAPAGGSVASDLFIMTQRQNKEAAKLAKDYHSYLKIYSEYVEEYKKGDVRFVKTVDPNQGRVVFALYQNMVILAVRPDGYDKGETLIEQVIQRYDELNPGRRKRR